MHVLWLQSQIRPLSWEEAGVVMTKLPRVVLIKRLLQSVGMEVGSEGSQIVLGHQKRVRSCSH